MWGADLGKAKSAVIMGWIAIGLSILMTVIGVVFNLSAASLQNMSH
jgi:hypothetical protein